jgi:hypothetical protein
MKSRGIFPSTDNDFNNYMIVVVAYLLANKLRLLISAANVTALTNILANWTTVYGQYINPNLKNTIIIEKKNNLHNDAETLLKAVFDDIPKSVLTVDDRNTFNLHEHSTEHAKMAKLDQGPVLSVDSSYHLLITIRIKDPQNPVSRAMPDGQKVILEQYVGDAGLMPPNIPFASARLVGKCLKEVDFLEADLGKTVYLRACYVNGSGDPSPWSIVISDVVR